MTEQLISAVRIEKLFGLYTYDFPAAGKSISDAAILYGDNGLGKSTILRLVFHMLSPAGNKGHRSALLKVPFKNFEVDLASGVTVKAYRPRAINAQGLLLSINRGSKTLVEWDFNREQPIQGQDDSPSDLIDLQDVQHLASELVVKKMPNGKFVIVSKGGSSAKARRSHPRGEKAYMTELARNVPTVFLLNADRRLDSDSVADPSDEVELRRVMRFDEPKRINDLVVRSREIALSQALNAASRWIGRKAVQGANQGSTNVHSVYVNVLRQLVAPAPRTSGAEAPSEGAILTKKLADIETRSAELARYEFTSALSTSDFKRALATRAKGKRDLAASLLQPYIDSLESRLAALDPIYRLVDRFVTLVNGFLSDKSIIFKLSSGFQINNRLGDQLRPGQLSSGEQQLLLLFCYVLTSRDQSSVFIIDEPEISLNVKWQRRLIQSLLDITSGARIQFIFASHSIELLSQHRKRVIQLGGLDAS